MLLQARISQMGAMRFNGPLGVERRECQAICVGNSLTKGDQGTPYPTALAALLGSQVKRVQNLGINGRSTTQLLTDFYTQQSLAYRGLKNIVILDEATNDIWFNYSTTAAAARSAMMALVSLWKGIGCRVILGDIIARVDFSAGQRAEAVAYNSALAADHSFADGYVRLSARFTDYTDETVYHTDHLHLNTNGYAIKAGMFYPEVVRLIGGFSIA